MRRKMKLRQNNKTKQNKTKNQAQLLYVICNLCEVFVHHSTAGTIRAKV